MVIKKTLTAVVIALSFVAAPAFADLFGWDDGDSHLDEDEFSAGFNQEDRFGAFDSNTDGMIDSDEFSARMGDEDMGLFDGNADGMLDNDEFTSGAYWRYDADRNGGIEDPELGAMETDMGDGGLFGFWSSRVCLVG